MPPPLETDLEVRRDGDHVQLIAGEDVVAEARPGSLSFEVPPAPEAGEAEAASRAFRGHTTHWFPGCFVCGPEHATGLRVFPGELDAGSKVACPWRPDASLANAEGAVRPEFLWAAIDCPGAFTFPAPAEGGVLLGQLTAELNGSVRPGERCAIQAWELRHEGRKHWSATVLYGESGQWVARSEGLWIEVATFPS